MHAVGSSCWSPRWLVPLVLIVIPLFFAALPDGPARRLVEAALHARGVRADIATLNSVRTSFTRARELDLHPGLPARVHDAAVADAGRALDVIPDEPGLREPLRTLREAFARYVRASAPVVKYDGAWNAIDAVLARLQTGDETRLREPLTEMHLAETPDTSRSADTFVVRLNELAIPEGTRTRLAALFATYRHDAGSNDAALLKHEGSQVTARAMEIALADADHALIAEQQRAAAAFERSRDQVWWQFGATLLAVAVMTAGRAITNGRTQSTATLHGGPS